MITERLQNVMRDVFDDPGLVLRRDMTADDVSTWDSISHVAMLAAVEEEFGIRIEMVDVKALHNVGDLIDLVSRKVG
jgi:acyl carrier protein